MEFLNVLVAAFAAFAFGAVWYMTMSKPWMAAAKIECDADGRPVNANEKTPFIIGFVGMVLAAGMMRHIFGMAGINEMGQALTAGLGIGLFSVMPWVAMNYAFGQRAFKLTLIDGVNVVAGSAIMAVVLTAF
jgi:hypothetical protein